MNFKFFRLSIKFKLLILLVTLSVAVLVSYAAFVLRVFTQDKITYIYDSILLNSKSIANLIRTEVDSGVVKAQAIMSHYSFKDRKMNPSGYDALISDANYLRLLVFQFDPDSGRYVQTVAYERQKESDSDILSAQEQLKLIEETLKKSLVIRASRGVQSQPLLSVRVGNRWDAKDEAAVVVIEFSGYRFLDSFLGRHVQSNYLVQANREIVLSPNEPPQAFNVAAVQGAIKQLPTKRVQNFGVLGGSSENLLISFADVGIMDLRVVTIVPKKIALNAANVIRNQSILFVFLILSIALLVSVIAAGGLTTNLNRLHFATREIAKGNLGIQIEATGHDEIADVSRSFNQMVNEIKRLMGDIVEKTRMEEELKTAGLVQSTLFPSPALDCGRIQLRGYYKPATECSGDWWNFIEVGSRVFVSIGDATGHGVPAALVTCAARAAFSLITEQPDMDAGRCLTLMNQAIFDTTKGKMNMSAFIACIDKFTGSMSYATASHDFPLWLRRSENELKWHDVKLIMATSGPTLGESRDSIYQQSTMQLNPGDWIFLFTDGLTELRDEAGGELGIRKLAHPLVKSFNAKQPLDAAMDSIQSLAHKFAGSVPANDDLTFLLIGMTES